MMDLKKIILNIQWQKRQYSFDLFFSIVKEMTMRTTNRMFWGQYHHLWSGRLIARIFFFMLFYWENWDKKTNKLFLFDLCPKVCTSWWKNLYVWVYPPILPQPLAKMDGCHTHLWDSICLWNPPESIPWIYRGGSKPEQEDDETLGQLCSDRVCMNTDWSCTISSRLFSSVLVVFLSLSPRNPSTDKFNWPPLTPENKECITLNTSPPEIKTHFKAEKCHFWNNIFPQIMNVTGKMSFIHLKSNVACIT